MSSDNGIYVLNLKDQYRVIETNAIENIYWNDNLKRYQSEPNSKNVVKYFQNAKSFTSKSLAMDFACEIEDNTDILEYGINNIRMTNMTWDEVVQDATTASS
jgi:hypothetical protein